MARPWKFWVLLSLGVLLSAWMLVWPNDSPLADLGRKKAIIFLAVCAFAGIRFMVTGHLFRDESDEPKN